MKLNLSVTSLSHRIRFIFFHKQLRFGQTEFIDTLLDVSYHEHVGRAEPFPGDTLNQRLLNLVAVLILVHQDFLIKRRQLIRRRARGMICAAPRKNFQCKMLQIIKIHQIFLFLGLLKPPGELLRQMKKHQNRAGRLCHIRKNRLGGGRKIKGLHLFNAVLGLVSQCRCQFFFLRINLLLSGCCQTTEHGRFQTPADIPVGFCLHQLLHGTDILHQHRKVSLWTILLPGNFRRLGKLLPPFLRLYMDIMNQKLHPFRLFKSLIRPKGAF